MKNKLRQQYSILLNKSPNVFIAIVIALIILLAIFFGGLLMNIFAGAGLKELKDYVYQAMLMIIDPGFLAVDSGFAVGTTSLLIVLFGMIVFLGGSIGYVCSVLSTYMDNVKGGSKKVYLSDHMLILNWNPRVVDIFAEECYRGETKNIFVLVKENREEVAAEIRRKRAQLKKEGSDYHHVNCFVREGDLFSNNDLIDSGVERAKTVIILDDENSCRGEDGFASMVPIKILMLVSKMKLDYQQTIIVESADSWTKALIEDIEAESEDEIVAVSTNEILGKMLAQISIMPELNRVYGDLMSHKGNEFYCMPTAFPADDKYSGIEDFMAKHRNGVALNIMEVKGESCLFAMGENLNDLTKETERLPEAVSLKINKSHRQKKRHIVIIGKNSKQNYIYDCYEQYVTEHGADSLHIHRISTEEGLDMVHNKSYMSEYEIKNDFDKAGMQQHLRGILASIKVDSILILSNDMDVERSLDTEVLVDLVNVRRIIMEAEYEPELVVEILDARHLDIAGHYGVKSIVFSNQYVSRLITQFGDNRSLYFFFADLFAYDTDKEAIEKGYFRSKEIYVRDALEVFEELPPKLTQRDLVSSAYYSSEPNNPIILIGYIQGKDEKMVLFGNHMEEKMVELKEEDKVIVYCRH